MTPKFVQHDGDRWRVTGETTIDGDPGYTLLAQPNGHRPIWARVSECIPDDRPRKRRFRNAGYVLEFDSRGNITIREAGRRKRYDTSLAAIYSMTVKAHALHERKPKTRVNRGLLRR